MLFRYYIADTFDGCLKGTNDSSVAKNYADCDDYFVVDTATGVWLQEFGKEVPVEEVKISND